MLSLSFPKPGLHKICLIVVAVVCFTLLLLGGVGSMSTKAAPTVQTPPSASSPTPNSTTTKPSFLTDPVPDPHQEGVQYFPQTGHTLRGKFLQYWQQYGGLAQFGYPLTEEFHQQDSSAPQMSAPAQYFPQTGHNLSGTFLAYWQAPGGLAVHGYPISEPAMERSTNGKDYLVQWFERSRMELHSENAGTPYEVLLGVLGRQLAEKKGYPFGWYPLYGRAADFSWASGGLLPPRKCALYTCSCTAFVYDTLSETKSLHLVNVKYARVDILSIQLLNFNDAIVFGRFATAEEQDPGCQPYSLGYVVYQSQTNPANRTP